MKNNYTQDSLELNILADRHRTTEFELFSLAYYDGHGYAGSNEALQEMFIDFLQAGIAPVWLKTYVTRRLESACLAPDSIKKSAFITTGSRSAIVKWRPSVDLFSFTLVGSIASEYRSRSDSAE